MKRFIVRAVRALAKAWQVLPDKVWVPLWLSLVGVQTGAGCRFQGMPIIKRHPQAQIRLGNHVSVVSRRSANPRGMPHAAILAAVQPTSRIEVGDHCGLSGVSIVAWESITIGSWVLIGPGTCIWDNDGHPLDAEERRIRPPRGVRTAPIRIEDDVFIGSQAIILKGITLGAGAVVATRAVVTKDVPPGAIVAGNPARVVGHVQDVTG